MPKNRYNLVIKRCQLLGAKKELFGVEKELFGAKIRSFSANSKFILNVIKFVRQIFLPFQNLVFYYFIFLISEPSQLIDLQNMVV